MIKPDTRHEELLRRALHGAADRVEPGGDGLERIRSRVTARHALLPARLTAAHAGPAASGWGRLLILLAWVKNAFGPGRQPSVRGRSGASPRRVAGLRPSTVVTVTALLVAAAAMTVSNLPQIIASQTGIALPLISGGGPGSGPPAETGAHARQVHHKLPPSRPGGVSPTSPASGSACSPSGPAQHGRTPSPTTAPPVAPSPTASQTSSPSTSPSPTPTTSPSVSPSPTQSPSGSPSPSASGTPDPVSSSTPPSTGSQVTSPPSPAADMAAVTGPVPAQPCTSGRSSGPLSGGERKTRRTTSPPPTAAALRASHADPVGLPLL